MLSWQLLLLTQDKLDLITAQSMFGDDFQFKHYVLFSHESRSKSWTDSSVAVVLYFISTLQMSIAFLLSLANIKRGEVE